jgi:hypothetical protein
MLRYPQGLIAVILAIISFYGMTYVVVALNIGWRFGYWVCGATFGALMVLMSIFWLQNPVGPRGNEAKWTPVASAQTTISQAQHDGKSLSAPASYPGAPWAEPDDQSRAASLASGIQSCLTSAEAALAEDEKEACLAAQKLMPQTKDIPVIAGSVVAISPEVKNLKFAKDEGLLAEAEVTPVTHDPRVAKDAKKGQAMGSTFRILFIYDYGALRLPPLVSLIIFGIYFLIHIVGLSRAEKRKLQPAAV